MWGRRISASTVDRAVVAVAVLGSCKIDATELSSLNKEEEPRWLMMMTALFVVMMTTAECG